MRNYITTYTKKHFDVLNPQEDEIDINDIAHALTMITRAGGHFSKFYSVAQHCVCCALEAVERGYSNRVALACLLHDGSEAYMSDLVRPLKSSFLDYLAVEEKLQNMIYHKFLGKELTPEEREQVDLVDDAMLFHEFRYYMNEELEVKDQTLLSKPVFVTKAFDDVEEEYLKWFYRLTRQE